ncbi:hypothetical protein PspCFBP13506_13980 [Pseudomonas sp. CFBP13506]|nr:hypothetical protein PspCFBP13506_13980 [Pseudomonas sp. CFBP13506]
MQASKSSNSEGKVVSFCQTKAGVKPASTEYVRHRIKDRCPQDVEPAGSMLQEHWPKQSAMLKALTIAAQRR